MTNIFEISQKPIAAIAPYGVATVSSYPAIIPIAIAVILLVGYVIKKLHHYFSEKRAFLELKEKIMAGFRLQVPLQSENNQPLNITFRGKEYPLQDLVHAILETDDRRFGSEKLSDPECTLIATSLCITSQSFQDIWKEADQGEQAILSHSFPESQTSPLGTELHNYLSSQAKNLAGAQTPKSETASNNSVVGSGQTSARVASKTLIPLPQSSSMSDRDTVSASPSREPAEISAPQSFDTPRKTLLRLYRLTQLEKQPAAKGSTIHIPGGLSLFQFGPSQDHHRPSTISEDSIDNESSDSDNDEN